MARIQLPYNPAAPNTEELGRLSTGTPVLISQAISGKVVVEVDDTETDALDEAMASLGFAPAPSASSIGVDGAVIHWPVATPWSEVLDRINVVPADSGVVVQLEAGSYTMDVAADLDRVQFIGMVESSTAFGGIPTTITMVAPFALLGSFLNLTNIIALSEVTIFDGAGPFRVNLMGSSELLRSYTGVFVPTIKLAAGGVLNISLSEFSLLGGGINPTVEMDDGSVINALLTGASLLGDQTAALKLGAVAADVTAGLDSTCVVAGQNGSPGSAFGTGITFTSVAKNGNAFFGPYNATTAADWNGTPPDDIGTALDRIAAAIGPIP